MRLLEENLRRCFTNLSGKGAFHPVNNAKMKEMYELQLQAYQNQLEILRSANEDYRTLRHDMKHHIVMLTDFIYKGENEKALEYLGKISSYAAGNRGYVETGNSGIDSLINYMAAKIKKASGQVLADIYLPPGLAVDNFDMSVILGNLLLNACEAMENCPQKELTIVLRYNRGILLICIENTYDGILEEKNGKIVTRKEDASRHGVGLASVRRAVRKYDGNIKIHSDERRFRVEAVL